MSLCQKKNQPERQTAQHFGSEENRILHGDALQVLEECVPDGSVDLIFADPPYNIGKDFAGCKDKWKTDEDYLEWCYKWLEMCVKKLKPNGSFYVMTSTQLMRGFSRLSAIPS